MAFRYSLISNYEGGSSRLACVLWSFPNAAIKVALLDAKNLYNLSFYLSTLMPTWGSSSASEVVVEDADRADTLAVGLSNGGYLMDDGCLFARRCEQDVCWANTVGQYSGIGRSTLLPNKLIHISTSEMCTAMKQNWDKRLDRPAAF